MQSLRKIIGLAPSEMNLDQLLVRVDMERERVRKNLAFLQSNPSGRVTKRKVGRSKKDITRALAEAGLTEEQFLKGLELLKKGKE